MSRPIALPPAMARELGYARVRLNRSQAAIGRQVGVSKTVVSSWESGRRSPSLAHLMAWADAVGYVLTLTPRKD